MAKQANHPVRTTEKSLRIIEALLPKRNARIRDLEAELEMSKSGIHNHLSTLRENEYVVKEGNSYRLSLKFLDLGGQIRNYLPLYRVGRPKVDELAEETGELVNLMTEENGRGVHIYQSRGQGALNLDTHVGKRMPLHNIAIGKAILAHLAEERVTEIIDRHGLPKATENTIDDPDRLFDELSNIREQGFAIDNEEREKGLQCVAAPIIDSSERVLGGISISSPSSRVTGDFSEEFKERVQSVATMIELEIKYIDQQSESN